MFIFGLIVGVIITFIFLNLYYMSVIDDIISDMLWRFENEKRENKK
ncbi:MAG: hypothetical protein IIZ67_05370 [Bacilli bacterium]|nr:hypothetical protein [Bacilli bacterium]